jgi:hypothetical protein
MQPPRRTMSVSKSDPSGGWARDDLNMAWACRKASRPEARHRYLFGRTPRPQAQRRHHDDGRSQAAFPSASRPRCQRPFDPRGLAAATERRLKHHGRGPAIKSRADIRRSIKPKMQNSRQFNTKKALNYYQDWIHSREAVGAVEEASAARTWLLEIRLPGGR